MICTVINKNTGKEQCNISCIEELKKTLENLKEEEILCIDLLENYVSAYIEYKSLHYDAITKDELINMDEDDKFFLKIEFGNINEGIPSRTEYNYTIEASIDISSCWGNDICDVLEETIMEKIDKRIDIRERSNKFFYKRLEFSNSDYKKEVIEKIIIYLKKLFNLYDTEYAETTDEIMSFYMFMDKNYFNKYFIENAKQLYKIATDKFNI